MKLLKKFLKKNQQERLRVHCVGDAMVDEYYQVKVNRISPEFPMPIMKAVTVEPVRRPGGAANVVHQFRNFNTDVELFCLRDHRAFHVFEKHGIKVNGVGDHFLLPIKRRYLDESTQIIRHDIEREFCGLYEQAIVDSCNKIKGEILNQDKPHVAILSDYNKGMFLNEESTASLVDCYKDVITIIDPKIGPISKWKGCTIFKPNAKEAEDLSGKKNWREQAEYFKKELECESVVITMAGEKVVGLCGSHYFEHSINNLEDAKSVIGAGDCFAAFFAMAVGHGFSVVEASEMAFNAGAIYVRSNMNKPVSPSELALDKIVEPEDLKNRDFELSFTNGCFDFGLTAAHVEYLQEAKSYGDKLVVALNSDESVRKLKGENRPIMPLKERMKVLSGLSCVDFVTSFNDETPLSIVEKIRPDVIVKGGDYKNKDVAGSEYARVVITDTYESMSTTEKIEKNI